MRIYNNFAQAWDEIKRNVSELGFVTKLYSMQDKIVEGNDDYDTKELIGEVYTLDGVRTADMKKFFEDNPDLNLSWDWVVEDFAERVNPNYINPGEAWKLREDVWKEFMVQDKGRFSYTYNERIRVSLNRVIEELKEHGPSRQAVISVWNPIKDVDKLGIHRVPCSMYYQFILRNGELHMIYTMRSSDILIHFPYDVATTLMLQEYVAEKLGVKPGRFTHFLGSVHMYKKDCKGHF